MRAGQKQAGFLQLEFNVKQIQDVFSISTFQLHIFSESMCLFKNFPRKGMLSFLFLFSIIDHKQIAHV